MIEENKKISVESEYEEIGKRLGLFFESKSLSAYKLQQETGISQITIKSYFSENGKRIPFSFVLYLQKHYGLNPDWLADGIGEMVLSDANPMFLRETPEDSYLITQEADRLRGVVGYLESRSDDLVRKVVELESQVAALSVEGKSVFPVLACGSETCLQISASGNVAELRALGRECVKKAEKAVADKERRERSRASHEEFGDIVVDLLCECISAQQKEHCLIDTKKQNQAPRRIA